MVGKFNSFYTTETYKLVERLSESINKSGKIFVNCFYCNKGVILAGYSFSVVPYSKVLGYLNKLSANKAIGLDGIPSRFVRDGTLIYTPPQTVFVGGYTVFTLSESPTDCVSETFCFFNNFKNH